MVQAETRHKHKKTLIQLLILAED